MEKGKFIYGNNHVTIIMLDIYKKILESHSLVLKFPTAVQALIPSHYCTPPTSLRDPQEAS